jgi:hypothetical protein
LRVGAFRVFQGTATLEHRSLRVGSFVFRAKREIGLKKQEARLSTRFLPAALNVSI